MRNPDRGYQSWHRARGYVTLVLTLSALLAACVEDDKSKSTSAPVSPPAMYPEQPPGSSTDPTPLPSPAPAIEFSADPASVDSNASTTLAWSVVNATSCDAAGDWSGAKPVNGSQRLGPLTASKTYHLSCAGNGGSASKTVIVTVGQPAPGSGLAMPSLEDERNTYRGWNWTWAADVEPGSVTERIWGYSVVNAGPDIHGDTEGDDLWSYLMMYRRTGNSVYLSRAQAWANYFKTAYRASPEFAYDDGFLLDHLYGWGLVTWYEHTCETGVCDDAALAEAEALAAASEAQWSTRSKNNWPVPGEFRMAYYSLRHGARHLLLATRVAEVTRNPRWIELRDRLIELWLKSPDWDARGMYFFGDDSTDGYLGTGSYAAGTRIVSPFHIGVLTEAFDQAYRATGRTELRDRILKMARFVDQYGLDPGCQYTGYRFGIRDDKPWHSYTDGNTASCTAGFWDAAYTTSLVNTLVRGYLRSGDTSYYARAKYFFNRGTKGVYGDPNTRTAPDNGIHHFVDTRFDSSSGFFYLSYNKGELQYTYLLFQYPHP